jgi:hypothetical protein
MSALQQPVNHIRFKVFTVAILRLRSSKPSGSIKCWERTSIHTTRDLWSSAQLHGVSIRLEWLRKTAENLLNNDIPTQSDLLEAILYKKLTV